jgi:hypothetical protein
MKEQGNDGKTLAPKEVKRHHFYPLNMKQYELTENQ